MLSFVLVYCTFIFINFIFDTNFKNCYGKFAIIVKLMTKIHNLFLNFCCGLFKTVLYTFINEFYWKTLRFETVNLLNTTDTSVISIC